MVLNRLWDIWAGQVLSICVNDYLNLQLHLMDIETLHVLRPLRLSLIHIYLKSVGLNPMRGWKLQGWSVGGESGIPSVAVKCVEIRKNTGGEGDFLDDN